MARKKDREPLADPNPLDWIRASDALKILSAAFGDLPAEDFIIHSIANRSFDLGASLMLHESDIGVDRSTIEEFMLHPELVEFPDPSNEAWYKASDDCEGIFPIDRRAFSRVEGWQIDIQRSQLSSNKILASSSVAVRQHSSGKRSILTIDIGNYSTCARRIAFNLSFRMSDFTNIMSALLYDDVENSPEDHRISEKLQAEAQGSDKDHYDWGPVENELIGLIESGGMSSKFGPVWGTRIPQAISMYVKTRVTNAAGKQPSFETVRKRVRQKILPLWRERDAARK